MTAVLSRDQAAAAVKAAVAERDAIQANLLELDNSFGKRLLAGAVLTGGTRKRWDTAAADLTTLWETFDAYSSVVDRAAELMAGLRRSADRQLAEVSSLLYATSVRLSRPSPALARGDRGRGGDGHEACLRGRQRRGHRGRGGLERGGRPTAADR